jgi:hypothetical protein
MKTQWKVEDANIDSTTFHLKEKKHKIGSKNKQEK